jgi:hypothetical protein
MPKTAKKSAGGRPTRHADERLSKNRTFRVRGQLDKQLQEAAAASGRSVSEEIEFRLSRSFDAEDAFGFAEVQNARLHEAEARVAELTHRMELMMRVRSTRRRFGRPISESKGFKRRSELTGG